MDPLESKYVGLSSYNYCFNNPINYTDEDGNGPGGGDTTSYKGHPYIVESVSNQNGVIVRTLDPVRGSPSTPDSSSKAVTPASSTGPSAHSSVQSAANTPSTDTSSVAQITCYALDQVIIKPEGGNNGFWHGVARFAEGFLEGGKEAVTGTVDFAVNIFRADEKNSLYQVAKGIYNVITDPVGAYDAVKNAVKNTNWSDPKTYGKIIGNLVVNVAGPGALAKGVKVLTEATNITRAVEATGELSNLGRGGNGLAGSATLATPGLVTEGESNLWRVGNYNELKGVESGLQAHHVGQKGLMNRLVPGYNQYNAPSILVPEVGHVTNMPSIGRVFATRGVTDLTARQVLARDIFELRRVYGSQGLPNTSLKQLIEMNKTMYPGSFIK